MAKNYTQIFHSMALQNIPRLGFFWQPCFEPENFGIQNARTLDSHEKAEAGTDVMIFKNTFAEKNFEKIAIKLCKQILEHNITAIFFAENRQNPLKLVLITLAPWS
jgi:hypothetical protein